jgi:photosystem II stability/assembly factor-like uncharacterized protein
LDWSAVVRLDFACVNPPGEAVAGYFKQFYFAAAQPRVFCDTAKLKKGAAYANIRMGAASEGSIYSVAVAALEGEAPAEPMRKTNAPHGSPGGSPSNGRAKKSTLVVAATETSGLVLSDDAGKTWRELAAPKKAAHVAIATDPNVMYGAFFADGVWKTIDQGKTWTKCPLVAKKVVEVVISPVNPQDVYAIGAADWNGQFYASHDGGQTWTTTSQLKHDLAADPTLPEDGGGLSTPTNLALNPFNPRELFISANWRPCWSDDAGQTWTERDAGADITCTQDIQFHDGRVYVAAMDEGTLVSADNGAHWRQLWPLKYSTELSGHNWRVALNSNRIIAASSPWQYGVANRVVVSEDGGKTCQSIATGLPNYIPSANTMWGRGYARALAVDPQNPQIVYLGIDGDPSDGKAGGGVFKSTDGGLTWKQLPHQPGSRRVFFGLAVDPTNSQRVYWAACGNAGGLWRSEDGGASWQHVFKNEGWPFNLLVTGDGTVYCPGRNLWRSTDHGKTWKQLTKHTGDGVIVGLECDPRDPKRLWYSTVTWGGEAEGGVFKTVDGGTTWQEITGNIPYRKPLVLRFNPATEELWAGGVGLYRIKQPK